MKKKVCALLSAFLLLFSLCALPAAAADKNRIAVPKTIQDTRNGGTETFRYNAESRTLRIAGKGKVGGIGLYGKDPTYQLPFAASGKSGTQNICLLENRQNDLILSQCAAIRSGKIRRVQTPSSVRTFSRNSSGLVSRCSHNSGTAAAFTYNARGNLTGIALNDRARYGGGDCSKYYFIYQRDQLSGYHWELYQYWGRSTLKFYSNGLLRSDSYRLKDGRRAAISYTYYKSGLPKKISCTVTGEDGDICYRSSTQMKYSRSGAMTALSFSDSQGRRTECRISWQSI